MVRHYKRKGVKFNWSEDQMKLAIQNVIEEGKSIPSVAQDFAIPLSTLYKMVNLQKENKSSSYSAKKGGYTRTFSPEQEEALVQYIKVMQKKLIGLGAKDVRSLAYRYAEKLKLNHRFSKKTEEAGKDWLNPFMARHRLSSRKPEHTSAARMYGFNKTAVNDFFNLYEELMQKYNFKDHNIYNVDETGITIVPKSSSRVIAATGARQVSGWTAAERGQTVTAEICMSATGEFMPPLLIFPRVKVNPEFLENKPPGAWAKFHHTGWMQHDIFTEWLIKFIEFSKPSAENPVLLLLDGHSTHVMNIDVIELARNNNIEILCFPPHCTHKVQPLDVGFMKPLSTYYAQIIENEHCLKHLVNMRRLFDLFGQAFMKAAKAETAKNSFKKCGLVPRDRTVFKDDDFAAEPTTELNISRSDLDQKEVRKCNNVINTITEPPKIVSVIEQQTTTNKQPSIGSTDPNLKILAENAKVIVESAKLLINCLSPLLPKNDAQDVQIDEEENSNSASQLSQVSLSASIVDASNESQVCVEKPQLENVVNPPKKRKNGKAAIITSDEYRDNLINIKKEKTRKDIIKQNKPKLVKSGSLKNMKGKKSIINVKQQTVIAEPPSQNINTTSSYNVLSDRNVIVPVYQPKIKVAPVRDKEDACLSNYDIENMSILYLT